jgi:hypothetical protein
MGIMSCLIYYTTGLIRLIELHFFGIHRFNVSLC